MFSASSFILLRTSIPGSQTDVTTMNMNATLPHMTYVHTYMLRRRLLLFCLLRVGRIVHLSKTPPQTATATQAHSYIHTYMHMYVNTYSFDSVSCEFYVMLSCTLIRC